LACSDNGPQMTSDATREFFAGLAIAQRLGRPHTPTDQAWIVTLKGSGFVARKARASIRFRRFAEPDEDGRMRFRDAWEGAPGFDLVELDVHGSKLAPLPGEGPQTYNLDQIVFEWPTEASIPGLYRIDIEFDNESDHYVEISQDPDTCELTLVQDGVVRADTLHMVVPPDLDRKATRLTATTVDCVDETDPESILLVNLADDTSYEVTGQKIAMTVVDPTATDPLDIFDLEQIGETVLVSGARRFWDAPDSWQPNLQAFPEAPTPFDLLGLEEMVSMTMSLLEVDADLDQAILRAVLVIALVTLVVVTLVVIAAAIVLLIATGVIMVETFGAGAALTVVVGALAAAITGVLFGAMLAVIDAIVAAVPNVEPIAVGATGFTGLELAHRLSPLRLQRVLWPDGRPAVTDPSVNARRVSSTFTGDAFVEVFRTDNLGGRYDLTVTAIAE